MANTAFQEKGLCEKYFGDTTCHGVQQRYALERKFDPDGGRARGASAGLWKLEEFADKALTRDRNRDGKLAPDEVQGLIRPHFSEFDTNHDGFLERSELQTVVEWLNHHHPSGGQPVADQGDRDEKIENR